MSTLGMLKLNKKIQESTFRGFRALGTKMCPTWKKGTRRVKKKQDTD